MDSDNKIFINKIEDYAFLAQEKGIESSTNFLNPYEQSVAMDVLPRFYVSELKNTPKVSKHKGLC